MKKFVTTCALLTTCAFVSFAQSKQATTTKAAPKKEVAKTQTSSAATKKVAPEQKAETIAKSMQKEYKLNEEQYRIVFDIQRDYAMQEEQMIQAGNTGGALVQAGMQRDERMKRVLQEDQYVKYETKYKTKIPMQGQ